MVEVHKTAASLTHSLFKTHGKYVPRKREQPRCFTLLWEAPIVIFAGFGKSSRFMHLVHAKQDFVSEVRTLKTRQESGPALQRNLDLCIPRKGTVRPIFQQQNRQTDQEYILIARRNI